MPTVVFTAPAARQLDDERPDLVGSPFKREPSVRRVYLRRIRYYVYFQIVDDGDRVVILAFWHGSRGSNPEC